MLVETLRRHRHRDGDDIADRVAGDDAGGANAERMLLAVDGDAGLAHGFEVAQQIVEPRQRARRALLVAGADEAGDRGVVETGEIGLAVGGAIERKRLADRRHRAQPLRADHLIDEDQVILLDHGEIDGLLEFAGELREIRPRHRDEIGARRGGEPQDGRAEPHPAVRRGGDQEFLCFERGDDALHGGARQVHALRDLPKAQARRFVLQRAQDRGGARDHLHLALRLSLALRLVVDSPPRADCLHSSSSPLPRSVRFLLPDFRFDTGSPPCGTADAAKLNATPGATWSRKIALEEHFLCPGFEIIGCPPSPMSIRKWRADCSRA